jgi:hypothetical protein
MGLIPGWGLFNGAAAWWLGRRELREIEAGLRAPQGRKKATIGRRLGMAATLVWGPVLAVGLALLLLSDSTLLDEDFNSASPAFSTAGNEFADLVVEGGAYVVRMKDVSVNQIVRHSFETATDTVRFEADIILSALQSRQASHAVGCWSGTSGYLFTLTNSGEAGIATVVGEASREPAALSELTVTAAARPLGEINRIRIDCVGAEGTGPAVVTGWLNDQPVASVAVAAGHESFDAVGFLLTASEPTEFTIDNVLATAESPEQAMAAAPPIADPSADAGAGSQPDWFAENGVTFVFPGGWQQRLLDESEDGAWRYSVSPDLVTENQLMFAYLPESVSDELFGPTEGRIASILDDAADSKVVQLAGLEAVRVSLDEQSTDAVTGAQIRTEMMFVLDDSGGTYTLMVRFDDAHEEEMLTAWQAMLDAFAVE